MRRRTFLSTLTPLLLAGCTTTQSSHEDTSTQAPASTTTKTTSTTTDPEPDISLVDIRIPEEITWGETFELRLTFENTGGAGSYVDSTLTYGEDYLTQQQYDIKVEVPANSTETVALDIPAIQLHDTELELEADQHIQTTRIPISVSRRLLDPGKTYSFDDGFTLTFYEAETVDQLEFENDYYDPLTPNDGQTFLLCRGRVETTSAEWTKIHIQGVLDGHILQPRFKIEGVIDNALALERNVWPPYTAVKSSYPKEGWYWFEVPDGTTPDEFLVGRAFHETVPVAWQFDAF